VSGSRTAPAATRRRASRRLAQGACAFALLLGSAQQVAAGDEAMAAFSLGDVDGKTRSTRKLLHGKANLLAFWRLRQSYSEKLLGELAALRKEYSEADLQIVTVVSGSADPAAGKAAASAAGFNGVILLDPKREMYGALSVRVSPVSFFIDDKGKRRLYFPSFTREYPLIARANIDHLLGKLTRAERDAKVKPGKAAPIVRAGATQQYRFGRTLLKEGRREMAMAAFEKAWHHASPSAEAGVELALLYLDDGRDKEALAILEKAAPMIPKSARAKGARGIALIRAGKAKDGGALLEEALRGKAHDPRFDYEMGRLLESRGKSQDAMHRYREGLERALKNRR